ncbi:MAG: UTP--glucose-1-phosphate uridylyltransferase, partial [Deltaproteobacteria bacterium]
MNSQWEHNLTLFRKKMTAHGLAPVVVDTFAYYYRQVATGETGLISDRDIRPVQPDEIVSYADLDRWVPVGRAAADKAVMIRLNGGLGTSMGLSGPKSLLPVKNGKSFLEIIIGQAH